MHIYILVLTEHFSQIGHQKKSWFFISPRPPSSPRMDPLGGRVPHAKFRTPNFKTVENEPEYSHKVKWEHLLFFPPKCMWFFLLKWSNFKVDYSVNLAHCAMM